MEAQGLATTQIARAPGQANAATALSGSGTGLFATLAGGVSFMDLIFARLTADGTLGSGENNGENSAATGEEGQSAGSDLLFSGQTLPQIIEALQQSNDGNALLSSALSASQGDVVTLPLTDDGASGTNDTSLITLSTPTPALDELRTQLSTLLNSFLQGIPAESRPAVQNLTHDEVRALMQDMNAGDNSALNDLLARLTASDNGADSSPLLIASGLSPEELNDFFNQLREGTEAGNSYIVGMISILPPQSQSGQDAVFIPRALLVPQNAGTNTATGDDNAVSAANAGQANAALNTLGGTGDNDDTLNNLASQLNNLVVGEEGEQKATSTLSFDEMLRILEEAQQSKASGKDGAGNLGLNKAADTAKAVSAGLSTVSANASNANHAQNPNATMLWNNAAAWSEIFPDGLPWGLDGAFNTQSGAPLSLSGTAALTSLATQASHATLAHPGTQQVAATLQKAAGNGETQSLKLKLDPPELGQLEIEMEFSHDKTMKARIVTEKPETFMMLQRDAHVLERALQNAGLDVADGGISFELSQDGSLFDQDGGGHDGEAYNGSTGGENAGEEIEIIETTVDWHIDPESGLTRYNILV